MDGDKRIHDERIVHGPPPVFEYSDRLYVGQPRSIWSIRSQSIEAVDYRKNSCSNWDVSTF